MGPKKLAGEEDRSRSSGRAPRGVASTLAWGSPPTRICGTNAHTFTHIYFDKHHSSSHTSLQTPPLFTMSLRLGMLAGIGFLSLVGFMFITVGYGLLVRILCAVGHR